jgi:hypothetical protein
MKTRLLFLLLLIDCSGLLAQDSTVVVKAGSNVRDVLTTSDVFLFPQYIYSQVYFRDGTKAMALMNYNSLFDQVLFIDPKGDTLALKDEKTIKLITINKDTFYYDEGYVRLVASNGVIKLAEKRIWEVADIRKIGSHDRPANTFSITSYTSLTDRLGKTYDLVLNEDLVFRKKTSYYFGDQYNHFVPASKKNVLSLFPKQQSRLAHYLKENEINFTRREDLQKLVQFIEQHY